MEEFFVYHVVTERNLLLGQTIIFDESNHNGVYNRVNACFDFIAGKQVQEDLKKLISSNLENWKKVAYRERALERVRQNEFTSYPSRMACLYVSQSYEDALTWATSFLQMGRKVFSIVKLKVKGRMFKGNAFNCFEGRENDEAWNDAQARKYWQNAKNKDEIFEYLVDGEISVIDVLKTFE